MLLYETLSQPLIFLIILAIGFGCGFLLDARNLVYFLCNKNKVVGILLDVLIGLGLGAVLLLSVLAFNYGELRLYLILSFLFGIFLQRISVGRMIAKLSKRWYTFFKGIVSRLNGKQKKSKKSVDC